MQDSIILGAWGEAYAARLYERAGFQVLLRNSFNRSGKQLGEIDVIARRKDLLTFIEVKTRIAVKFGLPEESISYFKQKRIISSVQWFLAKYPEYAHFRPRIDVCAILLTKAPSISQSRNLDNFVKYSKI
ncbi:MAG TPA: YraN family protein, partial [Candidatus Doudnabacteria bacterium]|nr:YraN family protein [Candidatus Doudnabacteria bacterium]